MKKWLSKIKLILALGMLMGLITGCSAGSTVETKLTINNDLSGSRVMELVINDSVFNEHFTGTIEELNAAVKETCPSQLSWVYDDSTGTKVYTITLSFTSPEDYKSKVQAILGEDYEVTLNISQADSVWASGIVVEENFSSGDLLAWLKTVLVEKGFVDSSNVSKIFSLGDSTVSYRGQEYSASSNIRVDEVEYLDIQKIELLTDVNAYDVYDKTIVLTIPTSSMEKKGDEIKTWLAARVPEGATSAWTDKTNSSGDVTASVFTVSKEAMNAEGLQSFLNYFFDVETCVVEQNRITDNTSPFEFSNSHVESIDFSNYVLSNRTYYTDIYSYVIGDYGYKAGRYLSDLSYESDYNDTEDYPGYKRTASSRVEGSIYKFTSYSQKLFRVANVNITSTVGLFGDLTKEVTFTLDLVPTDAEQEVIINNIKAYGLKYAELKKESEAKDEDTEVDDTEMESTEMEDTELSTEESTEETAEDVKVDWKVKVSDSTKGGVYKVTIKQEGDEKEISLSSQALFGYATTFSATMEYGFGSLSCPVAYSDGYYLGDFVKYRTEDATGTYTLDAGFGTTLEYADREGAILDGSKVKITGESVLSGGSIIVYGSQFNIWALLFYILLLGGLVCVVLVLKKEGMLDQLLAKLPKKAAAQGAVEQAPVAAPVATPVVEDIPKFCENCGAPRDADACVCTNCGTRFSE